MCAENEQTTDGGEHKSELTGSEPTLADLTEALCALESERVSAQMAGFETGFEHPNTMTMYRRVIAISKMV